MFHAVEYDMHSCSFQHRLNKETGFESITLLKMTVTIAEHKSKGTSQSTMVNLKKISVRIGANSNSSSIRIGI